VGGGSGRSIVSDGDCFYVNRGGGREGVLDVESTYPFERDSL
jgi:hypothetical protein